MQRQHTPQFQNTRSQQPFSISHSLISTAILCNTHRLESGGQLNQGGCCMVFYWICGVGGGEAERKRDLISKTKSLKTITNTR